MSVISGVSEDAFQFVRKLKKYNIYYETLKGTFNTNLYDQSFDSKFRSDGLNKALIDQCVKHVTNEFYTQYPTPESRAVILDHTTMETRKVYSLVQNSAMNFYVDHYYKQL